MKRIGAEIIIVLLLLAVFAGSFLLYNTTVEDTLSVLDESPAPVEGDWYFSCVLKNETEPFWLELRRGVEQAALDYHVAVSFNAPRFTDAEREAMFLDIAVASRVDGIITHVSDPAVFAPIIDKAVTYGIPVVTVVSDAIDSKRAAFIGANRYQLGFEGGRLVAEATGGTGKVALVLGEYPVEASTEEQDMLVYGFRNALKDMSGLEIAVVTTSNMGILSAEEITSDILLDNPDINMIYCTTAMDTLGVAQVVVDMNKVGLVGIVGYESIEEILRYIDKGVVYGTVASEPYEIGYNSIRSLVEVCTQERTSAFVDTGMQVITKENVAEYLDTETEAAADEDANAKSDSGNAAGTDAKSDSGDAAGTDAESDSGNAVGTDADAKVDSDAGTAGGGGGDAP